MNKNSCFLQIFVNFIQSIKENSIEKAIYLNVLRGYLIAFFLIKFFSVNI
jgi:hypothetical protein